MVQEENNFKADIVAYPPLFIKNGILYLKNGFPKGYQPFGQVKGWKPLQGVGQRPTDSRRALCKGWIKKQSCGLFFKRERSARESVPLSLFFQY